MSAKGNGGGAIAALVFAVSFGAVGFFAAWAMVDTLVDGYAARDWVRVKAEVLRYGGDGVQYRYRVGDRDYTGTRLGVGFLESSEVDGEIDAKLTAAAAEKQPITVFVNPDKPEQSVVDPSIPWTLVLFMTPFALGFGGVGLGALFMFSRMLRGGKDEDRQPTMAAGPGAGAVGLWVFGFFWNVIAFPIALIAVPEMIASGEWLGLLVLVFPLIGLFILWAAIRSTWTAIRMGGARITLQPAVPRLGEVVGGNVTFKRGVTAGDAFKAKLECITVDNGSPLAHWKAEKETRVIQGPQGPRLAFSFDTPDRLPALAGERDESTTWKLELRKPGQKEPAYAFAFELAPPPGAEHESEDVHEEALEEEAELAVAAPMAAGVRNLLKVMGAEEKLAAMSPKDRLQFKARMDAMTPEQRAALAKVGDYAKYFPMMKKLVFWAIGLFVAVQVLGVVTVMLFSS
jgi:hypothetical protein